MAKWIKNIDTVDHTWNGQFISAGEYFEIQQIQEVSFANNIPFRDDITAGLAIIAKDDSGSNDITDSGEAITYLCNLFVY